MRIDRELRPIVQLLLDDLSRCFRHEAERIPGQVDEGLAIRAEWQMKLVSEMTKRILGVELTREIFVGGEAESHRATLHAAHACVKGGSAAPPGDANLLGFANILLTTRDRDLGRSDDCSIHLTQNAQSLAEGDCMNSIVVPSGSRT